MNIVAMRRSWIPAGVVASVFGITCTLVYLEGASLSIALASSHDITPVQRSTVSECVDRFGFALYILELGGLAACLYLAWPRWNKIVVTILFFVSMQGLLIVPAFLVRLGVITSILEEGGKVIKRCLCS